MTDKIQKEFNLSEEIFEGDGEASFIDGNFYHEKDVKEFIDRVWNLSLDLKMEAITFEDYLKEFKELAGNKLI